MRGGRYLGRRDPDTFDTLNQVKVNRRQRNPDIEAISHRSSTRKTTLYAERRHDLLTPGRTESYQHQPIEGGPGLGSRHNGVPPWNDSDQRKDRAKEWPDEPLLKIDVTVA